MDQSVRTPELARPVSLPRRGLKDLVHIPGPSGLQLPLMNLIKLLRDPLGQTGRMHATYGPVFRGRGFGGWRVGLLGAEANAFVLMDQQQAFSSEEGWKPLLARLFPGGLMLMDFEQHRAHRRILTAAFKPEPMRLYLAQLNAEIARATSQWRDGEMLAFPAVKALTLHLAARAFLGEGLGSKGDAVNQAFVDMVKASTSLVRAPLPGSAMARGVRGRAYLKAFFADEIPRRRGSDAGDMFTAICNARSEQGEQLSQAQIVDHMSFMMLAAHDTQTTALTALLYYLAKYPAWQDRVRDELRSVCPGPALSYEQLAQTPTVEMVFKEVLRLHPPVPALPRRVTRDVEFGGYRLPRGALVGLNALFTHRMGEYWQKPNAFYPPHFSADAVATRPKHAWIPFGGGVHMCLGLHFAYMQTKVFLNHVLSAYEIGVAPGYEAPFQLWPMSKPRDGLPITLRRLERSLPQP